VAFHVGDDLRVEVETFDIHTSYVPVLACMDIEYWKAIHLPETDARGVMNKSYFKQKYMQDLRIALVGSLREADKGKLRDGSWKMDICHGWGVRTWNDFSHSDFGRGEYKKWCQKKKKVPYDQNLTEKSESS
jgi:hypothetical protein